MVDEGFFRILFTFLMFSFVSVQMLWFLFQFYLLYVLCLETIREEIVFRTVDEPVKKIGIGTNRYMATRVAIAVIGDFVFPFS
jgi:hypothetical protein